MPYHDYDMIEGQLRPVADARCQGCNPKGWQDVDGVKLPSVSPWAQLDQADLDKVHAIWKGKS